jgi:hypothetical protein
MTQIFLSYARGEGWLPPLRARHISIHHRFFDALCAFRARGRHAFVIFQ